MPGAAPASTALSSLDLEGIDMAPIGRRLCTKVLIDNTLTSTTVTAAAKSPDASVEFFPVDADSMVDGHQITLSPGDNVVTVVVTHGADTSTYRVDIRRLE